MNRIIKRRVGSRGEWWGGRIGEEGGGGKRKKGRKRKIGGVDKKKRIEKVIHQISINHQLDGFSVVVLKKKKKNVELAPRNFEKYLSKQC